LRWLLLGAASVKSNLFENSEIHYFGVIVAMRGDGFVVDDPARASVKRRSLV
jgi:hypothetical protein